MCYLFSPPRRLMNIYIYLHKACTKLLQLTLTERTMTLSKMYKEVFLESVGAIVCFIFIFYFTPACIVTSWIRLCFSPLHGGDGLFLKKKNQPKKKKKYRPMSHVPVGV